MVTQDCTLYFEFWKSAIGLQVHKLDGKSNEAVERNVCPLCISGAVSFLPDLNQKQLDIESAERST